MNLSPEVGDLDGAIEGIRLGTRVGIADGFDESTMQMKPHSNKKYLKSIIERKKECKKQEQRLNYHADQKNMILLDLAT